MVNTPADFNILMNELLDLKYELGLKVVLPAENRSPMSKLISFFNSFDAPTEQSFKYNIAVPM